MEFNRFVFPAPNPSYTPFTLNRLMWIPRSRFFSLKTVVKQMDKFEDVLYQSRTYTETGTTTNKQSFQHSQVHIPVLFQPYYEGSEHYVLYFHGNAEDIGYAAEFTRRLSTGLKANVLSVEYPGYGAYDGEANSKAIIEDAEIVFDFLTQEMGIDPENIFVFGRSIGSGPSTHLAAHRNPGMLILMSPYTTIRNVVKDIAGSWASYLIAERFENIQEIQKAKCPCFFIHGKKDKLIDVEHTKELFSKCKAIAAMNLSDTMTHNDFNMSNDIVRPIRKYMRQLDIKHKPAGDPKFPEYVQKIPLNKYKRKVKKSNTVGFTEHKPYQF